MSTSRMGERPVALPAGVRVLLATAELDGGLVPTDVTVWARGAGDAGGSAG